MCKNPWSETETAPEPAPVTTPEPPPEATNTPAIVGGVFGTLIALIVIIVIIVVCLRKKGGSAKNKLKGFGFTKRIIPNRNNTVSRIDNNPAYTGLGARKSEYQYDVNNQSRTNALDRNTYYSGYSYGASVAPSQAASDKYVEIPLR